MPLDERELSGDLRPTIAGQLAPAEVLELDVSEDTDVDGDRVLRLLVTFRSHEDRLEPKKLAGLVRHIRSKLMARGDERFPLVTFRTEKEAREIRAEAR